MPQRRPIVFLAAQPTVARGRPAPHTGLDPLYEHGDVVVLIQPGDAPSFNAERCMRLIESRLEPFDPERDMFAFAGGDQLALFMTALVLADICRDEGITSVTWLRYERGLDDRGNRTHKGAKYVPVEVPVCGGSADAYLIETVGDVPRDGAA
jgi:hypothetical protein